jgi:2-oxoglutarate/2-oxoacid ferredoxin oxidoreductase subunit beta
MAEKGAPTAAVDTTADRLIYTRPEALTQIRMTYCPGCAHGIIHRLIAEVMDEMKLTDHTVGIASVGCSVFAYDYFSCDMIQAAHGRAPAVATAVRRALPESIVFAYQGDGDLASIGTGEIIHAAARGENITIFFINNAVFGMTGGQMAPTTLIGQKTSTSPQGRDPQTNGYPIRICELLSSLQGPAYIARTTVISPKYVRQTKRIIRKAFQAQIEKRGFSLVELLSTCPTRWKMSVNDCAQWVENNMAEFYPMREFVDFESTASGTAAITEENDAS